MTDSISSWHAEHVNFAKLLDILEEQLDQLHGDTDPNYELMLDLMFYMTHYPDVLHHPREDLALAILRGRQPGLAPLVDELARQHVFIKTCGEELVSDIDSIVNGSILSREKVETPGRKYIDYFRGHMQSEEKEILPLAAKLLNAFDWSTINAVAKHKEDPLFGGGEEKLYASLRREIARQARRGHRPGK
jgi:hemerythrin-like domain-containing protein